MVLSCWRAFLRFSQICGNFRTEIHVAEIGKNLKHTSQVFSVGLFERLSIAFSIGLFPLGTFHRTLSIGCFLLDTFHWNASQQYPNHSKTFGAKKGANELEGRRFSGGRRADRWHYSVCSAWSVWSAGYVWSNSACSACLVCSVLSACLACSVCPAWSFRHVRWLPGEHLHASQCITGQITSSILNNSGCEKLLSTGKFNSINFDWPSGGGQTVRCFKGSMLKAEC